MRAVVAVLIVGLVVGGILLALRPSDPLLENLGVDLPETDLDPPGRWRREKYRAVLIVRPGEMEVRMSQEPEGGGRRTRILGSDEEIPWPVGLTKEWEHTLVDRARERVGLDPASPPRQERPAGRPGIRRAVDHRIRREFAGAMGHLASGRG